MVFGAEGLHFFLATLVFVVLCMAALQALLLAGQEWILRHKQASGFLYYFPPLQKMETCLFILLTIAIVLLTLILASSFILFDSLVESLWKKTLLSVIAWSVLFMLLVGRGLFGWRGKVAIHWTLLGVSLTGGVYLGAIFFIPIA